MIDDIQGQVGHLHFRRFIVNIAIPSAIQLIAQTRTRLLRRAKLYANLSPRPPHLGAA